MRLLPRTLAGQLIALLLVALAISQAIAFVIFTDERSEALRQADRVGLLENTASVLRMLYLAPPEIRSRLASAASSSRVRIWVTEVSVLTATRPTENLTAQISRLFGAVVSERARVQIVRDGIQRAPPNTTQFVPFQRDRYDIIVSVPFEEGGWLNAQTQISAERVTWPWATAASTALMVIAILLISAFTARRAMRPLRALASKAEALGRGSPEPALAEVGPDEIRDLTAAFNLMQERLGRFVADRVQMIAAMGHDLRTPITSLKLRAELLDDAEAKAKMTATLEEMQSMIEATLSFARQEADVEPTRSVDLAALIASIVDDHADLGADIGFEDAERLPYHCRPISLKRAVSNLVENALRYGKKVRVSLSDTATGPIIAIEDRGPGIPDERIEDMFQPFVRLETSRSRITGGVGLGLSIARSVVLAHGGELLLSNRPAGGLRAEIRLPRSRTSTNAPSALAGG